MFCNFCQFKVREKIKKGFEFQHFRCSYLLKMELERRNFRRLKYRSYKYCRINFRLYKYCRLKFNPFFGHTTSLGHGTEYLFCGHGHIPLM